MRKFEVKWTSKNGSDLEVVEAKGQVEALMMVMRKLSPDGIRAPQCRIFVKPVKD